MPHTKQSIWGTMAHSHRDLIILISVTVEVCSANVKYYILVGPLKETKAIVTFLLILNPLGQCIKPTLQIFQFECVL